MSADAITARPPELHRDDTGAIDEVVARGADVLLERMYDNAWCLQLAVAGRRVVLHLGAAGDATRVDATVAWDHEFDLPRRLLVDVDQVLAERDKFGAAMVEIDREFRRLVLWGDAIREALGLGAEVPDDDVLQHIRDLRAAGATVRAAVLAEPGLGHVTVASDRDLLRRALLALSGPGRARWARVRGALGHGSGVSAAICRALEIDPDEIEIDINIEGEDGAEVVAADQPSRELTAIRRALAEAGWTHGHWPDGTPDPLPASEVLGVVQILIRQSEERDRLAAEAEQLRGVLAGAAEAARELGLLAGRTEAEAVDAIVAYLRTREPSLQVAADEIAAGAWRPRVAPARPTCRVDDCRRAATHGPADEAVACWDHAGDWLEVRHEVR